MTNQQLPICPPEKIFQTADGETVNIIQFLPRSSDRLSNLIKTYQGKAKKIFYLQKTGEEFAIGKRYSYLLHSNSINFFERNAQPLPTEFRIEETYPIDDFKNVLELAIRNNRDSVIFPKEMQALFGQNSKVIKDHGYTVQIYHQEKLIGHACGAVVPDSTFGNKTINLLMRLIVDENFRDGPVKEILMKKISEKVTLGSQLYLQVFAHNHRALRFFLRRTNLTIAYEKWEVTS